MLHVVGKEYVSALQEDGLSSEKLLHRVKYVTIM